MFEIHLKEKPSQLHYLADNWYRNMFFCVTSSKLRDTTCQILGRVMFRVKEISEGQLTQGKFHGNTNPESGSSGASMFFSGGKGGLSNVSKSCQIWVAFFLYWYWINDIKHRSHWVFKVGGIRLNWHSPGLEILFPSFHSWPFNHPNGGHLRKALVPGPKTTSNKKVTWKNLVLANSLDSKPASIPGTSSRQIFLWNSLEDNLPWLLTHPTRLKHLRKTARWKPAAIFWSNKKSTVKITLCSRFCL